MSTRANVIIRSRKQKLFFQYEIRSDSYPESIVPELVKFKGDVRDLTDLCMFPGKLGNPFYYYDINADYGSILVFQAQSYWQNAPDNWKEKGWLGCYKNNYGNYGYTAIRKGKRLLKYERKIDECDIKLLENSSYTKKDFKQFEDKDHCFKYWMGTLKYDPTLIHTWMSASEEIYPLFYENPLEKVPLSLGTDISKWRLKIGK